MKFLRTPYHTEHLWWLLLEKMYSRRLPQDETWIAYQVSVVYVMLILSVLFLISNLVCINRQKQPPRVFCKKFVIRNLAKFTGKNLCQSLLFNKVARELPLGGFLSHLVTSFQAFSYIAEFTRKWLPNIPYEQISTWQSFFLWFSPTHAISCKIYLNSFMSEAVII